MLTKYQTMQQDRSIMTIYTTQVTLPYINNWIVVLFRSDVHKVD